jgi:polyisoprenoid-binding protein YceI
VDLGSVDTGIEIRDQRMRDLLFNITDIPNAEFTTTLDVNTVSALRAGEQTKLLVQGELRVHRLSVDIETELAVVRLADNQVIVSTTTPMLLSASSLGLADGVEQLRAIANLPDISLAVPVTFQLLFAKTP